MAELVQQAFETSIRDLAILEKYGLFKSDEIKTILNKRQEFEYRLRKVNKSKVDYLLYIAYEQSLLKLIRIRYAKLAVEIDQYEIEQNFVSHLKKLFEIALRKFKFDLRLWLSYIDFAKTQRMYDLVSAIYFRALQFHNKPSLWINFAKFELEEKASSENARKIFLKCLSFHPESADVWHEYFKFELLYCAKIKKRFKIMTESVDQNITSQISAKQAKDDIWNGKWALIVYENGVKLIKTFDFAAKFIEICNKLDFETTEEVKKAILNDLKLRFEGQEQYWNLIALNKYNEYKQIFRNDTSTNEDEKTAIKRNALEGTIEIFQKALLDLNTPTMWEYYFNFRFSDIIENHDNTDQVAEILYSLDVLWNQDMITKSVYQQWIKLYYISFNTNCLAMQRLGKLLVEGASKWPNDLKINFFIACFLSKIPENPKIVQKLFEDCLLKKLAHGQFDKTNSNVIQDFWELYLDWSLQKKFPVQKIMKIISNLNDFLKNCPRKTSEHFKSKILAINYHMFGILKTRVYYEKNKSVSPICKEFFYKMIEIENHYFQSQKEITIPISFQNAIYQDLIHYFGSNDPQIWLNYIKFTMKYDVPLATRLYQKALNTLDRPFSKDFIQNYSLLLSLQR